MTNDVYASQGFGGTIGFGKSPALLVVDFTKGFIDPEHFGGGNILDAMNATLPLLEAARTAGIPIAHTKIIYAEDGSDCGIHCLKSRNLKRLVESNPLSDFADAVRPLRGEIVLRKRLPSAFFETGLAGIFNALRVDTVLVTGCTTSGCVRASTLDAMCFGLRPMVITDCVGDRSLDAHKANLFDLGKKYADLMTASEAIARLRLQERAST